VRGDELLIDDRPANSPETAALQVAGKRMREFEEELACSIGETTRWPPSVAPVLVYSLRRVAID
jgi:hypothetical protein